ncbi:MAG TPA: ATP-binding cassette domain-containing protein [Thermomicrobiales bacterium]|nr:ATP-binding cassette domain-containing protein [Thermomicrobiales bacterium]
MHDDESITASPIIRASRLSKTFRVRPRRAGMLGALRGLADSSGRTVTAVDDISFLIRPGEVVGYIGPNGAGKSTTIKMLTGILVPSSGSVRVAGLIPSDQRRQLAGRIGVVFGQRTQLWWDLPLADSLELLRFMYRIPADRFDANFTKARELLDLDGFLDTPVRQLSLGQRMRGDLAAALLHDPPILYLDEPTIGLDLVAKTRMREFLATLNRDTNVTILLTTHDLADIAHLCNRIIVIDRGRILYDGDLPALYDRYGTTRHLIVDYDATPKHLDAHHLPASMRLADVNGPRLRIAFARGEQSATQVLEVAGRFGTVRDISVEEPAIEDVIRGLYGDSHNVPDRYTAGRG